MTGHPIISVQNREGSGKGGARAARRDGFTPGVLYGGNKKPLSLSIKEKDLNIEIKKGSFLNKLFEMDISGKKEIVLPRDVQLHPVTDSPIHVDFLRVTENTTIAVSVNVQFENETESPGIKKGGVLNIVRHAVELNCRASSIPEFLTASLEGLEIGDSIRISEIELPEKTEPVIKRDFIIATIAAPTVTVEEETPQESEETEENIESNDKDNSSPNEKEKEKGSE